MPSTTLTIDQLALSPLNVRTYSPDAEDTRGLQASILEDGLLNPIAVHPMKGSKNKWGAIAGGRRYRAIKGLIGNGDLPADYAVRVNILEGLSDAELIEHSITENLIRRDLRQYEIAAGVARAAARGHDVEQIAKGIGQSNVSIVERWLRLGRLADPVFEAFRLGRLTTEQASAYAATEDLELQRVTFDRLPPIDDKTPSPAEIRKAMNVGDIRAQRELAFVGAEAYRAAGGRFELDLFADAAEERGRIVDEGKLQQLVEDRLSQIRVEVRLTTGLPDLRFIADKPRDQYGVDYQLIVTPKRSEDGKLELPDGSVVAHIEIGTTGEPIVSYWWESRKAKYGSERSSVTASPRAIASPTPPPAESPFAAHQRAEAAAREEGISNDALFALSAVRKVILRAALIDDAIDSGTVGQDYLIWTQARALLAIDQRPPGLGIRTIVGDSTAGVSNDAFALAREHVSATKAAAIAANAVLEVTKQAFFTEADPEAAFLMYREASPYLKNLTVAVVAGVALERSLNSPDRAIPLHDVVAREAGIEQEACIRTYWSPTADMLDMLPKAQRVTIGAQFVDRATSATWSKQKSSELTAGVLATLTHAGSPGLGWAHPLLRFGEQEAADQRSADEEVAAWA